MKTSRGLNQKGFPNESGVYLVRGNSYIEDEIEVEVYEHPVKGLCCFSEDIGHLDSGIDDETGCHVSVQFSGLDFITKLRDLD